MKTKFANSPSFIKNLVTIEVIAFTVITFMKMRTSVGLSDGWIPSSIIDVPKLFIFWVIHCLVARVVFKRLKTCESAETSYKLKYLVTMYVFLGVLLILRPIYWLPDFEEISYRMNQPTKYELYEMYLTEFEQADLQDISVRTRDYEKGYEYDRDRDFEVTEDVRREIAAILREAPVQPQTGKEYRPSSDISIHISANGYWGYFNYDDNWTNEFGVNGKTQLGLYPPGGGPRYYNIDNSYINRIVDILPGYKLDHTLRNQFREDIMNAKAENFYISAVIGGVTYDYSQSVTQEALDEMVSSFMLLNELYYDRYFDESDEFPEGDVSVSFTMSEFDTTVDIVYVYPDDENEDMSTELIPSYGRSYMRICARGETRYFDTDHYRIKEILQRMGLYE